MFEQEYAEYGIDLSDYYLNMEWDIMSVTGLERRQSYQCCQEPYSDLFFSIRIRRKSIYYVVTLIIPILGISFFSLLVFYLPTSSGEKISFSVSILLSLIFLLLILIEISPCSSLSWPLLTKYLLFTLILVICSIIITILVLNVHFRSSSTHIMPVWFKHIFHDIFPSFLFINKCSCSLLFHTQSLCSSSKSARYNRTQKLFTSTYKKLTILTDLYTTKAKSKLNSINFNHNQQNYHHDHHNHHNHHFHYNCLQTKSKIEDTIKSLYIQPSTNYVYPAEIKRAIRNAIFIANHIDNEDAFENCTNDWKFVALVLDRIFFYIFILIYILGSTSIFLQIPLLYDTRQPIDVQKSLIGRKHDLDTVLNGILEN